MTRGPRADLGARIPAAASLVADSSVVLAYLIGGEAASEDAAQLFDRFLATGRNPLSLSSITVGEVLVQPFRQGPSAVATAEGFLRHFSEIRLVDVTYEVAREAARIRALTDLRMPDALIIASARVIDADVLVTGDRSWRPQLLGVLSDVSIVELPGPD